MSSEFIHLRVHSDFSMMDGLNKVKPLLDECVKAGNACDRVDGSNEHVWFSEVLLRST